MKLLFSKLLLAAAVDISTLVVAKPTSKASKKDAECVRSDVLPLEDEPILLSTAQNALIYDYWEDNYFNSVLPPLGPRQTVAYAKGKSTGSDELKGLVAKMLSDTFGTPLIPTNSLVLLVSPQHLTHSLGFSKTHQGKTTTQSPQRLTGQVFVGPLSSSK
jgi:hypothetical protein